MDFEKYLYRNKAGNFTVVMGNIFNFSADVMVVPAMPEPKAGAGLDFQVYKLAGKELESARKEHLGISEMEITDSFGLTQFKKLYHVVPPLKGFEESYLSRDCLSECYENCIITAKRFGMKSIVFPLIGSGLMSFELMESYIIAKDAICSTVEKQGAEDIDIKLVLFEDDYWYLSNVERYGLDDYSEKRKYKNDNLIPVYEVGKEYTMRVSEMQKLFYEKHISKVIASEIKREAEAYVLEDTKNRTENGYALRELGAGIRKWIDEEKKRDPSLDSDAKARDKLSKLSTVGERTLRNLLDKTKNSDDDRKEFGNYHLHRESKICLAVAMGYSPEERRRFVMLGENGKLYPCSDVEQTIEDCLERLKTNKVTDVEAAVGKKLGITDYSIRKDGGFKNAYGIKERSSGGKKQKDRQ